MDPFSQGSQGSLTRLQVSRSFRWPVILCAGGIYAIHQIALSSSDRSIFLLCGCNGGSSGGIQVQPQWTFAVLCDTRGDNNAANLYKSGVNEVVVDSMTRDLVKEALNWSSFREIL